MKAEYIVSVAAVGLAGLLGVGHLGASFGAAIGADTGSAEPRSSGSHARVALVASREAASADVMARVAHAVATPGTLAQEVVRARPRIPAAVAAHFESWATDWHRTPGADASEQISHVWRFLTEKPPTAHGVRAYLDKTLRSATDPDLGFAIPAGELPAAMMEWRAVSDPDQRSPVVRAPDGGEPRAPRRPGRALPTRLA